QRRAAVKAHREASAVALTVLGRRATRPGPGWAAEWREADARVRTAVDARLDAWSEPFEGRIARDLAALPAAGGVLVVASSMPVRDLDHYMAPRSGLRVLANRGVSGIDGTVSTALGVAEASG